MTKNAPEIIEIIDSDDDDENDNGSSSKETNEKLGKRYDKAKRGRGPKGQRILRSTKDVFSDTDSNDSSTNTINNIVDDSNENDDNEEDDDDEVVIVEPPPKKIVDTLSPPPKNETANPTSKTTTKLSKENKKKKENAAPKEDDAEGDDCEIAICGIYNSQVFIHMRQHCTKYPFMEKTQKGRKKGRKKNNMNYCDKCYCYVCDIPVKECRNWGLHCSASEKGTQATKWKRQRETEKQVKIR